MSLSIEPLLGRLKRLVEGLVGGLVKGFVVADGEWVVGPCVEEGGPFGLEEVGASVETAVALVEI